MYDAQVVRKHFELWGHDEIKGEPDEPISRWLVPYVNHMLIDRWLPTEGSALDAGCGCGVEAVRMVRRGLSVTALDISHSVSFIMPVVGQRRLGYSTVLLLLKLI